MEKSFVPESRFPMIKDDQYVWFVVILAHNQFRLELQCNSLANNGVRIHLGDCVNNGQSLFGKF